MRRNMNNLKTIVVTPEMLGLTDAESTRNTIGGPVDGYAKVPLVFRATRIRCNSLLKIPIHLYRDDGKTEVEWPFEYPLRKLLWRTRAAGLLTGAGYVLKRSNSITVRELQWLNPTTMRVEWDATEKQRMFYQTTAGGQYGPWSDAEMLYIPEFTLRDDIQPGDCPASVALGDTQLSHYLTRMASAFFEKGAMPVTLITSEDGFATETEKVTEFYRRALANIKNAWRVLAIKARGVQFHNPQSPLKDLAVPELGEKVRKGIALAFEIPVTLLDDDANYATAKEHKRGFYDETVIPDADMFAEEFNAQLLEPMGLHLEFKPEEMDLYQDDERESAEAANTFTDMLDKMPDFETFQFVATTYGIEYDETLAKKVFASKEKRRTETQAQMQAQTPAQPAPTAEPALPADTNPVVPVKTAMADELARWERAAVKRVKRGGDLSFNSEVIPGTLRASIHGALEAADSPDDVRAVFANAQTWAGYP